MDSRPTLDSRRSRPHEDGQTVSTLGTEVGVAFDLDSSVTGFLSYFGWCLMDDALVCTCIYGALVTTSYQSTICYIMPYTSLVRNESFKQAYSVILS